LISDDNDCVDCVPDSYLLFLIEASTMINHWNYILKYILFYYSSEIQLIWPLWWYSIVIQYSRLSDSPLIFYCLFWWWLWCKWLMLWQMQWLDTIPLLTLYKWLTCMYSDCQCIVWQKH
jgi:hypothetical protein